MNATAASLLGFLHRGPMTGWDLDRAVAATVRNFWNVTRSQVYRELQNLSELGYVVAGDVGRRDRRPFTITAAGRRAFGAWIAQQPGEAIIRMPILLTVFFAGHLAPGRLAEIVAAERDTHVAALASFRALYDELAEAQPYPAEVVRFAIAYHELFLDWLDGLPPPGPAP